MKLRMPIDFNARISLGTAKIQKNAIILRKTYDMLALPIKHPIL